MIAVLVEPDKAALFCAKQLPVIGQTGVDVRIG
jgi:hypothetical protein